MALLPAQTESGIQIVDEAAARAFARVVVPRRPPMLIIVGAAPALAANAKAPPAISVFPAVAPTRRVAPP